MLQEVPGFVSREYHDLTWCHIQRLVYHISSPLTRIIFPKIQEKATSFSALGFTRHLDGDLDGAIESYHKALSRKPDDPFASEMLNRAMRESLELGPIFIHGNDTVSSHSPLIPDVSRFNSRHSMSQSSIEDSNYSLEDSDIDMSMT